MYCSKNYKEILHSKLPLEVTKTFKISKSMEIETRLTGVLCYVVITLQKDAHKSILRYWRNPTWNLQ